MSRYSAEGECESCGASFRYFLIHGGSNQSSYAYCDRCGATALLSGSCKHMPVEAELDCHRSVPARAEALLDPCSCGGRFLGSASPRCPSCRAELSPEAARSWLEARASEATKDRRGLEENPGYRGEEEGQEKKRQRPRPPRPGWSSWNARRPLGRFPLRHLAEERLEFLRSVGHLLPAHVASSLGQDDSCNS